jgi:hypothetical protein
MARHTKSIASVSCQFVVACAFLALSAHAWAQEADSKSDQPPDLTHYGRRPVPEDNLRLLVPIAGVSLNDVEISNTDKNLQKNETFNDTEPSIAVKPNKDCIADPTKCEIVITAFADRWFSAALNPNAPLWHSTDGGSTWTKQFTIPPPAMLPEAMAKGCPCDQTLDYANYPFSLLGGSFLTSDPANIYTGTTLGPGDIAKWHWDVDATGKAQPTNLHGTAGVDQPWLISGPGVALAMQNFYVAYDFGDDEQVSETTAVDPPNFKTNNQDQRAGRDPGSIANAGLRLATDPRTYYGFGNGRVYSIYQIDEGKNAANTALKIKYMLNASLDFGKSWRLSGDLTVDGGTCRIDKTNNRTTGCVIASVESRQGSIKDFKFGEVNALMGGVDAIAVDPTDGDIYIVYGKRVADTDGTTRDHLFIGLFHMTNDQLTRLGTDADITPGKVAALPAVAVAQNQTVAVLYDTFEGMVRNLPQFDTHLAQSTGFGNTFTDQPLVLFLSPAKRDDTKSKQRVLGDYQQLKAVGNTFFGAFPANGTAFNPNKFSNMDVISLSAAAKAP